MEIYANAQSHEQVQFIRLFDNVLELMKQALDIDDEEIENSETTVRRAFWYRWGHRYFEIDFNHPPNLCAHFYRTSPLSAGLSRIRTLEAVQNCPPLQERLSQGGGLNVVSVGGGSGADIIGFCSAVSGPLTGPLSLRLTVIDHEEGWEPFFIETLAIVRTGDYGSVSGMFNRPDVTINTQYVCTDVLDGDSSCRGVLWCADIVMVKGVLSTIHLNDLVNMRRIIADSMATGSFLLLIDSPEFDFSEFGLEQIYPDVVFENDYRFEEPSIQIYGQGLARSSKAQITVYIKSEVIL